MSQWPSTAEESAILGFAEATSELDTTAAANLEEQECMAQMVALVQKHELPVQFERLQMTAQAKAKIDFINANPSAKYKHPFCYDHLADGFMGTHLTGMGELPIMSPNDLKILLALVARRTELHSRL